VANRGRRRALAGWREQAEGGASPERVFEKLKPFKDRVSEDIRERDREET
jgi:hypothetical protein